MCQSVKLPLPKEFRSLGPEHKRYQLIEQTEAEVTIRRDQGKIVHIPTGLIFECYDRLMAAPDHTLPMQQLIVDVSAGIDPGESVVGAMLVAAGLAEVTDEEGPITLKGIRPG